MFKLNNKIQYIVLLYSIFIVGCGSSGPYRAAFVNNPDYPLQRDIRHIEERSDHFWYRQEMRKDCYEHVYQNWWNFIMR